MTTKQTNIGWRQYFFKRTGTTGLAAIIVFFAVSVFLEYVIVSTSMSLGVTDTNLIVWNIGPFTITISPLFHLLPLSVIIVLFASWIYLTRHETYIPAKTQPQKKGRPLPPRRYEKKGFRRLRRFINRINKGLDNFGRGIKERIANTRLARYLEEHFAGKAVVKSAWIIALSFSVFALLVYLIVYPQLIPNAVNWLLGGGTSALQGFIMWTIGVANAIGQALSLLGWLGASIENGLVAMSLGFRNGVISLTTFIVNPLVQLDLVGKYVLIQNVAAGSAAIVSMYYGSRVHRRR
ncbi:MAG TPA: hypothetical protein VMS95_05410 [Candidatus Krumholzibacteriaceae bacterium]|nr:hypothetical protein [Candidatus Krumholzibacteriaceae bacterium]